MAERKLRFDAAESAAVSGPPRSASHSNWLDTARRTESSFEIDRSGGSARPAARDDQPAISRSHSEAGQTSEVDLEGSAESLHDVEFRIRQKLDSELASSFSSVSVRQLEGGICLEGVLETSDQLRDVERLVQSVARVDRILNRLTVRPPEKARPPEKPPD